MKSFRKFTLLICIFISGSVFAGELNKNDSLSSVLVKKSGVMD